MFARVLDSFMHWLLVFFRTFFSNCFVAAMFARVFDFFMSFLWCFASDQFAYFIFRICTCTRILDSFMHFPFVFFKMSYYSCFKAAMFALVLDSFMHWLFAFWLSSCFVAAMFARVFHTFMWFLPVFCKCSICSCFICAICTRKLEFFMHLFLCSLIKILYYNCFKAAL